MIALLLWLQLESLLGTQPVPEVVGMTGHRSYHGVSIAQVKDTIWTHIAVCGRVEYVKHESDGDAHLRLRDGAAFIVAEIVPYHPLPIPTVGQWVRVAGIHRYDKQHRWEEIHPVEAISVVDTCTTRSAGS